MVVVIDRLGMVMNDRVVVKVRCVMNDCVVNVIRRVMNDSVVLKVGQVMTEDLMVKIRRRRNVTVMVNIRFVMNETVSINSTGELLNEGIVHEIVVRGTLEGNECLRRDIMERTWCLVNYNRVMLTDSMHWFVFLFRQCRLFCCK